MADNKITFGVNLSVDNYWNVSEFARRAEDLGYGRVTMGEHIMDGNPPRPTLLNLPAMAAAAGATTNLRVMTGIVVAPLYHPVTLAKMVATVDQVSGGRLDFGIGISGQRGTKIEFDAVGVDVRTRGKRTDEMLLKMDLEERVDAVFSVNDAGNTGKRKITYRLLVGYDHKETASSK